MATISFGAAPSDAQIADHPGKPAYDRWCAGCHGDSGAGDGEAAAWMLPRPRDFTRGVYQIRTTASGELPTDADIRQVIDEGMPGTTMPGWSRKLSRRERDDLVGYLKTFSRFFDGQAPTALSFGRAPRVSAEGLETGRRVFEELECYRCHGDRGRGDGSSAPTLTDDWDHPIRVADLTANWLFGGGGTVEQIHARLRTGLDGTPMPSFSDALEDGMVNEEEMWRVAQYVRSLSPDDAPRVRQVIRVHLFDALPSGPADTAWNESERFYVPLSGQVIVAPRWYAPSVHHVWVQAAHDGQRLALRVSWTDPSRSPDAEWDEWLASIRTTMEHPDGEPAAAQGPDRLAVYFPQRVDGERPYFLAGSTRRPVHMWLWTSTPDALTVGAAAGLGRLSELAGGASAAGVSHAAHWEHGQWQVQFTRTLVSPDSATMPPFTPGATLPVGFFVADGSNGEDEVRGAVGTWYTLYLDVPTPPRVYVAPVVAMLFTAALGVLLVRYTQRRESETPPVSEES